MVDHAAGAQASSPPGAARRTHWREAGFGWKARLASGLCLPVLDLSAGGMRLGLRSGDPDAPEVVPTRLNLLEADGVVVATGLECNILRVADKTMAVRFTKAQPELAERHLRFMARAGWAAIRPPGAPHHG